MSNKATERLSTSLAAEVVALLQRIGVGPALTQGGTLEVVSPIDGQVIARLVETTPEDASAKIDLAHQAFLASRAVPAPR